MTTTTPTPALADLDNTAKEALRDLSHIENHLQESSAPTTVMNRALDVRMGIKELRAALARRAAQPVAPVQDEWRNLCDQMIDIWDDHKMPEEDRTYVEGAWPDLLAEIRAKLATPSPQIAEVAELPKPYGYAVEQKDGHVTFFKEDPKGFRGKVSGESLTWAELGINVHDLFTWDAIAASRRMQKDSDQ
ncbi:hypothetical protein QPK31_23450 [Massilia sp. YIM B02769]|uniref:hypothetical protein n=1 Tax=Massilia sp. YIM B02769 TaxID=3050129 RepID=UPI0025B69C6C|nr:hypothetical protein [Massilia sp. YIM B02769]MDN4061180.1 hypothetical protein [Massilia sp. YIM B02769]